MKFGVEVVESSATAVRIHTLFSKFNQNDFIYPQHFSAQIYLGLICDMQGGGRYALRKHTVDLKSWEHHYNM